MSEDVVQDARKCHLVRSVPLAPTAAPALEPIPAPDAARHRTLGPATAWHHRVALATAPSPVASTSAQALLTPSPAMPPPPPQHRSKPESMARHTPALAILAEPTTAPALVGFRVLNQLRGSVNLVVQGLQVPLPAPVTLAALITTLQLVVPPPSTAVGSTSPGADNASNMAPTASGPITRPRMWIFPGQAQSSQVPEPHRQRLPPPPRPTSHSGAVATPWPGLPKTVGKQSTFEPATAAFSVGVFTSPTASRGSRGDDPEGVIVIFLRQGLRGHPYTHALYGHQSAPGPSPSIGPEPGGPGRGGVRGFGPHS
nr:uncharacterized protein LOC112547667 [Pelodiscus sinensis]|eukprot:XP_025046217.1 uncharacterized protein LOC112547667 [Pelodiscus sinensis]